MSHHVIRAAEYRSKAHDLNLAAASSELAQVREKYEGAARRFAELADEEDLRVVQAARNQLMARERAEANQPEPEAI
jgi:hypothetical protein